jgi:hypothetical protein
MKKKPKRKRRRRKKKRNKRRLLKRKKKRAKRKSRRMPLSRRSRWITMLRKNPYLIKKLSRLSLNLWNETIGPTLFKIS